MNLLAKLLSRNNKRAPGGVALGPVDITGTIDRALDSAGIEHQADGIRAIIDGALAKAGLTARRTDAATAGVRSKDLVDAASSLGLGEFVTRSFSNDAGSRAYKLYVPAGYAGVTGPPVPLLVMLHGCTQSPDDFAVGTRMNRLADAHGLLVAYPAQPAKANGSRCWNWFRPEDQAHGRGEPSLIAGIAGQVALDYRIDTGRIFVAGLSAGAAMAVILGERYPDVFAAVGVHSGLPFAVAHDVGSAFTAMKGGAVHSRTDTAHQSRPVVPTIVFHGDADHTVAESNGLAIVRDATTKATLHSTVSKDSAPGGRSYTRETFTDSTGRSRVEYWRLHGAGHAWSGGSADGSYTDPSGPDASAEMLRFFLQQSEKE